MLILGFNQLISCQPTRLTSPVEVQECPSRVIGAHYILWNQLENVN